MKKITLAAKNFFWLIFLLSLPLQLGRHFWLKESFFWGLKIDYLSPTIFLTDILLILLLVIEIFSAGLPHLKIKGRKIFLIFGTVFILINIFFALNKLTAFYGWLKFFELVVLIWLVERNKDLVKNFLGRVIALWLVLEFFLSLGQLFHQGSLGGIFWWLGERSFRLTTPGIAKFDFLGRVFLRPYGTFSHPNSLAGFVLGAIFLSLAFTRSLKLKIFNLLLGFFLLILTFSRGIIFISLLLAIFYFEREYHGFSPGIKRETNSPKAKPRIPQILPVVVYLRKTNLVDNFVFKFLILFWLVMFGLFLKISWEQESFFLRWLLFLAAAKMFIAYPFFGVGLKNFIPRLPDFWPEDKLNYLWLQPVHNIYLLALAQVGVGGMGLLIWFLKDKIQKKIFENKAFFALLAILLTGLFDHYWLTLQQNFLLLGIIIGLF